VDRDSFVAAFILSYAGLGTLGMMDELAGFGVGSIEEAALPRARCLSVCGRVFADGCLQARNMWESSYGNLFGLEELHRGRHRTCHRCQVKVHK
jgi:hypothetical protein